MDVRAYNEEGNLMFSSTSGTDNERLSFAPSDTVQRISIEVFVFTSTTSEMAMVRLLHNIAYIFQLIYLHLFVRIPQVVTQETSATVQSDCVCLLLLVQVMKNVALVVYVIFQVGNVLIVTPVKIVLIVCDTNDV